jgi:hypothetical protein
MVYIRPWSNSHARGRLVSLVSSDALQRLILLNTPPRGKRRRISARLITHFLLLFGHAHTRFFRTGRIDEFDQQVVVQT